MLTLGSLFDGIGGFPLVASWLGIRPLWASEIETAPVRITRRHFPDMRHLGDIREIDGAAIKPVDIVTFGSPCQDLSVAGKRAGLSGERSGLFMEAVRIIREMRDATHGIYPSIAVWENVPGALSSNSQEDFRAVIEELARVAEPAASIPRPPRGRWQSAGAVMGNGWSLAWRVLDAKLWGVPQNRRRIFLVLDLTGGCAGEILFKRDGLHGHPAPGGTPGQGAARPASRGAGSAIPIHDKATRYRGGGETRNDDGPSNGLCIGVAGDPSPTLDTAGRHAVAVAGFDVQQITNPNNRATTKEGTPQPSLCADGRPHVILRQDDTMRTIRANGVGTAYPPEGKYDADYCIVTAGFMSGQSPTARGVAYSEENAPTLRAAESGTNQVPCVVCPDTARALTARHDGSACPDRGQNIVAICVQSTTIGRSDDNGADGAGSMVDTREPHAVAIDCRNAATRNASGTLQSKPNGGQSLNYINPIATYAMQGYGDYKPAEESNTIRTAFDATTSAMIQSGLLVRRLTPMECERLQGYPDGWTECGADGKPISDSARYKALGNSLALPCAMYVMEGVAESILYRRNLEEPQ